tara:strand:- start:1732 stop:1902 length:171 start_codon:yes stop_codon:yes gene_type:complete
MREQSQEFKANIKQGAAQGQKAMGKNAKKCQQLKDMFDAGKISKKDMMKKAKELGC